MTAGPAARTPETAAAPERHAPMTMTADEARAELVFLSPAVEADGSPPPPPPPEAREPSAEKRTRAVVAILRATADLLEERVSD